MLVLLLPCAIPGKSRADAPGSRSELLAALASARDGDEILLQDGHYGSVEIRDRRFRRRVTIRAQTPGGAVFDSLVVRGSEALRFEDLRVSAPDNGRAQSRIIDVAEDSNYIEIAGCEVNGPVDAVYDGHFGIRIEGGTGHRIEGNRVHDVKLGIAVFGSRDVILSENVLEDIGEDVFKFAAVTGVLIENNTGPTRMFPAQGAHDDFMQFQGEPSHRVTVRGNVFLPQNSTHAQGVFFGGKGGHTDLLIEENIIATALLRAISVNSGSGIVVRQNTVIGLPGPRGILARITVPDGSQVERNIWSGKKGERSGSNIIAQASDPAAPYHYARLFRSPLRAPVPVLTDLLPLPDGPAASLGAVARLRELLGAAP